MRIFCKVIFHAFYLTSQLVTNCHVMLYRQTVCLVGWTRISVQGSLQTASDSDKPSLERQLAQTDRDIETADKEITKMAFLMPEARTAN